MRKGLLWTLAFWLAVGVAHAQGPWYPPYAAYPGYGPMPGYAPPGYMSYPPPNAPPGFVPYAQPFTPPGFLPYSQSVATAPASIQPVSCESCQAAANGAPAPTAPSPTPWSPATAAWATPGSAPVSAGVACVYPGPQAAGVSSFQGQATGCSPPSCTPPSCTPPCCMPPTMEPCYGTYPACAPIGYRWYGKGEVLYWFFSNQAIPGLANLGSTGSTIAVPGFSSISINSIFPNYNTLLAFSHLGDRWTLGRWLDSSNSIGLEVTAFGVYTATQPYYASGGPTTGASAATVSNVASILGLNTGQASAFLNNLSGKNLVANAALLGGAEANLRFELGQSMTTHLDFLAGVRWLYLGDDMGVINQDGAVVVSTQNNFYGGQIGLEGECDRGRCFLDAWAKLALGDVHQSASIGSSAASAGSLLSALGNGGTANRDVFAFVPEAGLSLGWRCTNHMRVFVNYTIVYLSDSTRPASQIGSYLNGSVPPWHFTDTIFLAQGASVGLEFRY